MGYTPYKDLPGSCFWKTAHVAENVFEIDPVVEGLFKISPADKIATAGSCFAQHIANHLQASGFRYFVTEAAHPILNANVAREFNYGVFSARYGNVYTAAQLRQLFDRAFGRFQPADEMWTSADGQFRDPFRPAIQPGGFSSIEEFRRDRQQHFAAVRRIFLESDVFVFTLGLTECWRSSVDGAAYPLCPGVSAGVFDPARHGFVNYSVAEIIADMSYVIGETRKLNAAMKFILTVSPVPLVATAERRSVIQSTVLSKSVLRVAADTLSRMFPDVAYFPSYEIITMPAARGRYFGPDCRVVTPRGVKHVMNLFLKHYTAETAAGAAPDAGPALDLDAVEAQLAAICDETLIEAAR